MAPLSPRFPGALAPAAQELAGRLADRPWADDAYLAGSAALTLYLGHRPVANLDLMTATNRLTGPERRDLLADLLEVDPETRVETARDGYLFTRGGGGTGLSLYHYPYPLVDPPGEHRGLALASPVDLGLMKLAAIISRGTRRDFVDLYLLCRELPMEALLDRAAEKFGHVRDFPLQALKGLADLSLVAGEPMPRLAREVRWEEVEGWLAGDVRELARERVGLAGAEA